MKTRNYTSKNIGIFKTVGIKDDHTELALLSPKAINFENNKKNDTT
jgi:hypothetical protein